MPTPSSKSLSVPYPSRTHFVREGWVTPMLALILLAGAAQAGSTAHIGVGATVVRSARVSVEVGKSIRVRFSGRGAAGMAVHAESGLVAAPEVDLPAPKDGFVVVTVLG